VAWSSALSKKFWFRPRLTHPYYPLACVTAELVRAGHAIRWGDS